MAAGGSNCHDYHPIQDARYTFRAAGHTHCACYHGNTIFSVLAQLELTWIWLLELEFYASCSRVDSPAMPPNAPAGMMELTYHPSLRAVPKPRI